MASPPKPWETPGVNRQNAEPVPSNLMSSGPISGSSITSAAMSGGPLPCCTGGASPAGVTPSVPARPSQQSSYSSGYSPTFGGYGTYSPYSYGGGMYSSPYSMYGGGYGMGGYSRFGANDYTTNSFVRQAEESSRPAFQSIESIVQAFGSVSMMLDSTFQAMYNSFRAVIGVADNFTRMKMQFAQIFSAFAIFRTLRYLYRKLLVLLRLRPSGYAEEAWTQASDAVTSMPAEPGSGGGKSSWPVLMFFAIIFGGPWVIWKVLCKAFANKQDEQGWATGEEDHFVAQAEYDFKGENSDELSFSKGQHINVAPKELQPRMKGWLLASVDGKSIGIIPANYVKVLGKRRGRQYQAQIQTQAMGGPPQSNMVPSQNPPGAPITYSESSANLGQQAGCCGGSSANMGQQAVTGCCSGKSENSTNMNSIFSDSSEGLGGGGNLSGPGDCGTENMNAEDILEQNSNNGSQD